MVDKTLLLIPAYNEESRIAQVVAAALSELRDCEVLVVDDGSGDRTRSAAIDAGATVLSHPYNLGYGVAIQTGYKYALRHNYKYLIQMDGDGQHDPSALPELLAPVKKGEADFVLGSRFLSELSYQPPLLRRLGMGFFRLIVTMVIGQKISDCTSGYQAFNAKVIKLFANDLFPCDYPDADVLIGLHRAGFRIAEIPVRMYENVEGKSMHSGLKPVYYVFKMLLSIVVTLLRHRHEQLGDK